MWDVLPSLDMSGLHCEIKEIESLVPVSVIICDLPSCHRQILQISQSWCLSAARTMTEFLEVRTPPNQFLGASLLPPPPTHHRHDYHLTKWSACLGALQIFGQVKFGSYHNNICRCQQYIPQSTIYYEADNSDFWGPHTQTFGTFLLYIDPHIAFWDGVASLAHTPASFNLHGSEYNVKIQNITPPSREKGQDPEYNHTIQNFTPQSRI